MKGIGYILHHNVFFTENQIALNPAENHVIDFGDIFVNEKKNRMLTIENNGDFNFDFSIKKHSSMNYLNMDFENGFYKFNFF